MAVSRTDLKITQHLKITSQTRDRTSFALHGRARLGIDPSRLSSLRASSDTPSIPARWRIGVALPSCQPRAPSIRVVDR